MSEAVKGEVKALRLRGFDPYLHGSRSRFDSKAMYDADWGFQPLYPKGMEETADWDYAIQDTKEANEYFHSPESGYTSKDTLWYQDINTMHVFEKVLSDGSIVQVSLRNNLEVFKTVWEEIDDYFYYEYLWKRGPGKPTGEFISEFLNIMFRLAMKKVDVLWD